MLLIAFYVVLALLLVCYNNSCIKPAKFPPGPRWFPLIGCFPIFYRLKQKWGYMYLALEELSQKYGPILGLKLGGQKIVVISSHDLVKKVFLTEEFNGRPNGFFFRVRSFGKEKGILFTEGSIWMQHRRFTMRHLKAFGFGQKTMAHHLTVEAQCLVDSLRRRSKDGPVLMHTAFDIAVLNSLWTMFAGHRFENDDRKLKEILDIVHDVFRLNDTLGGIMSHMPFVRFVIPELSGYNELISVLQRLWTFLGDEIANHEAVLPADQPRDLIDAFLMEIKARRDNPNADDSTIFDHENLLTLCLDLFLAGSKTTTDMLAMMFAFLALNPNWIKELQNELNDVIGKDRPPALTDIPRLPKIDAFLSEALRWLTLAPLGLPHKTVQDVSLDEYLIPKDTMVLLNFHSVHYDKNYWDHPEEFRPQRFLDEEGKFRQLNTTMPFGLGKRRCLGEGLARSTLFLFFTYVLHHFDFVAARNHIPPDLNGYDGFVISPKPYYLELTPRPDV